MNTQEFTPVEQALIKALVKALVVEITDENTNNTAATVAMVSPENETPAPAWATGAGAITIEASDGDESRSYPRRR